MACDARMMDADARRATVATIAGHMEDALEIQREVTPPKKNKTLLASVEGHRRVQFLHGSTLGLIRHVPIRFYQNALHGQRGATGAVIIMLALRYFHCLQIFLLNVFLGTNNLFYGFHVLKDLLNGREWEVSGNFPVCSLNPRCAICMPDSASYYVRLRSTGIRQCASSHSSMCPHDQHVQ